MFFTAVKHNNTWQFDSDPGWHRIGNVYAKGYACDQTLEQVIERYDFAQAPTIPGNFCLVKIENSTLQVGHNIDRSFPLWASTDCVTNLEPVGEQIWADTLITVDQKVHKQRIEIAGSLEQTLTVEQATDLILERVLFQSKRFVSHNTLPINTFRSGGLDTAFLYALVNYLKIEHTEWTETVVESMPWLEQNKEKLKRFWAYKQIHHWNHPNVMLTGSQGDEYFLRGPAAIAMIMAWHDIDFVSILDQHPQAYHHWYFSKPANKQLFESNYLNRAQLQQQYVTKKDLNDQIINMLANDHQHWHLGETLTWTQIGRAHV